MEEAPKIIQQLCGKKLIFRFKLNDSNLTFGTQNYAVKRTFVPDDRLEMLYLNDKAEEELMDDDVDTMLMKKQNMPDKKDECTETNLPEQKKKGVRENKKQVKGKARNTMPEDEDEVRKARPRRTRMLSR
ncbi:hypothetical protein VPH35_050370 [Triticum aestivum]|uniref:Uncharacterized protein n=1 Tax=Triticum turgidum subsp. durum TaxID=4567 RepID=A0A9R1Q9V2_TRITD|nr:unnamed protein product [Triticum turgidum subsp. durum]